MTLSADLRDQVRRRAHFACEYCRVSETEAGGQLTVDHFRPQSRGGSDDPGNLVYCCHRCNLHKADYWPTNPTDAVLWNPRQDADAVHLLLLRDGTLFPITATGSFTVRRLRLNRPPLVAHRLENQAQTEERRLLVRYRELVSLVERMQRELAVLLDEHRALLEEQRALLRALLKQRE
jgi:hypothetical protein